MDCEEFTGLKRQLCEGKVALPGGRFRLLTDNEKQRYQSLFNGSDIPERDRSKPSRTITSRQQQRRQPERTLIGVGSTLHKMLSDIGITESSGCGCKAKAAQMDEMGVAWCESHRDELANWMVARSEKRLQKNKSKLLWLPQPVRELGEKIIAGRMIDEAIQRTRTELRGLVTGKPISVGITTAPRDGDYLLPRCVDSVIASGFTDITVFAEPNSRLDGIDCKIITRPEKLGAWRNWMQTLEDLLHKQNDLLLIVQDDCVFSKGVADFCDAATWPWYSCAAIQLCCSSYYSTLPNGITRMPGTGMVGAWATLMHRYYAQQILDYGRLNGWRGHHKRTIEEPTKKKAIDDFIGYAAEKLGYQCAIVRPSIVLHDAEISTLGHGNSRGHRNNRKTIDWIGQDAVALDHVPLAREAAPLQI